MTAQFIYPRNGNYSLESGEQMLNAYDDIFVQYETPWPAVNLTLFCLQWNTTSGKPYYTDSPSNPLPASGLHDMGRLMGWNNWSVFPTSCQLRLTRADNGKTHLDGEIFWMTRDTSTSTTYSPSSPATATSRPSPSSSINAPSPGLDTGAKAGIGIGLGAIFLAIFGVLIGAYLKRRGTSRASLSEKALIPGMYGTATKHEMDGTGLDRFHWLRARSREVDNTTVYGLDHSHGRAPEMDGTDQGPHELSGSPMSREGAEIVHDAQ